MRKVNIADLARLPHAPKTLVSLVKKIEGTNQEYWIHEWGNKLYDFLPSFWSVNTKTGKEEQLKFNISRHQYPSINLSRLPFDCHKLVALAFVKNHDPQNAKSVDHKSDPHDDELVTDTKCVWVMLKAKFKNQMWALQPHFCNFSPNALEWVTSGENSRRAKTQEHKDYQEKVKNYGVQEAIEFFIERESKGELKDYFEKPEYYPVMREFCGATYKDYKEKPFQTLKRMAEAQVAYHDDYFFEQAIERAIQNADHLKVAEMGEYNYIKEAIKTGGQSMGTHHPQQEWLEILANKLECHFGMSIDSFSTGEWDSIVDFVWKCCEDHDRAWHPEEFDDLDFGYFAIQFANPARARAVNVSFDEDLTPPVPVKLGSTFNNESIATLISQNFSHIRKDIYDDIRLEILDKEEARKFKP